jgi:2-polyprenyl-3-methyl-5-hydroxy-6-metoxy-1,4-benzoquinol methylase
MTNVHQVPRQNIFFRLSGAGNSPWEIGRAQSVIIKLVEQGAFQGEVLDVGCGIGDNAIYIASHAYNVHSLF